MGAKVRAADPLVTEPTVMDPAVARVEGTPEEIAAADMVVLLTEHDAFLATNIGRHASYVLDCLRDPVRSERRDAVRRSCVTRLRGGARPNHTKVKLMMDAPEERGHRSSRSAPGGITIAR